MPVPPLDCSLFASCYFSFASSSGEMGLHVKFVTLGPETLTNTLICVDYMINNLFIVLHNFALQHYKMLTADKALSVSNRMKLLPLVLNETSKEPEMCLLSLPV